MPKLKAKVTAEELATLAEPLRAYYTRSGDDYVLDADGVEDVGGLKRVLEDKKADVQKLKAKLDEVTKTYADLDPERAREALKKLDEIENQNLLSAGKVDEVVAKRTEAMRKDLESRISAAQAALEERDGLIAKMRSKLETLTIDSALKELALKAGVRDTALPDLLSRGRSVFKMKDEQVVPLNEDGTTRLGKNGRDPLTFDEYVALLQSDAPHLFEPNTGGGSSTTAGAPAPRGGQVVFRVPAEGPVRLADFEAAQESARKSNSTLAVER